ncbi:hypothetical protein Btru_055231 [Bulinus truncatus]|nr:hypothetical protein Btru_055231 [Bulinus truncatus]
MKTETGLLDPAQYRVTYIKLTPPFGLVKVEVKDADKKGTTSYHLNAQNTQGGLDVSFGVIKGDPVNDTGNTTKDGNSVFLIIIGVLAAVVALLLIVFVISLAVLNFIRNRDMQYIIEKRNIYQDSFMDDLIFVPFRMKPSTFSKHIHQ